MGPPNKEQHCLGRSSPEIIRVSECKRAPSLPARIIAHRFVVFARFVVCMTLPVRMIVDSSLLMEV
jgi:hypothetical protein